MKKSVDLRQLLAEWPYDPANDARIAKGDDGRDVLQVRTPVGIEQLELEGRPDGLKPYDQESALVFQLARLDAARSGGNPADFILDEQDCAELFSEGTLYYLRYVRLFQLKRWAEVIRDTSRNLRVFDLVHQYADREEDRNYLERWRPYIVRIHACASALIALEAGDYRDALDTLARARERIEALDPMDDETFGFERKRSLSAIEELESQIQARKPLSELERLERLLNRAIETQEFERAAELRDRIRGLKSGQPTV